MAPVGTGWVGAYALKVVAYTGITACVFGCVALRNNAKDSDRCIEVCQALERSALSQHELLQNAKKGATFSTHGVMALLFLPIWLASFR